MRFLLALCTLVSACGGDPTTTPHVCGATAGEVVRVLDGDTVELADGRIIRYLLVDTPEIAHNSSEVTECFGAEARALNESLVLGETVELEYDEECEDFYGRTLAYVYAGGDMLNELLITRGYARLLVIAPNQRYEEEFAQLEAAAQAAGAGLWGACE